MAKAYILYPCILMSEVHRSSQIHHPFHNHKYFVDKASSLADLYRKASDNKIIL